MIIDLKNLQNEQDIKCDFCIVEHHTLTQKNPEQKYCPKHSKKFVENTFSANRLKNLQF